MVSFAALWCVWGGAPAMGEEANCPNENLRRESGSVLLPDCRGYEMVSPSYKEGYPMLPASYSATGEKAIVYSLADLAGSMGAGESVIESALYLDTRTQGGWQISPLNAAFSEYVGQIPIAYEANSGMSLWEQHTPTQSVFNRGLYVRSPDGSFSFIGPLTAPSGQEEEEKEDSMLEPNTIRLDRPRAATSNYTHVLLSASSREDYWPFDTTQGTGSLYEYSGTNNQAPTLVGVSGEKGSTQLLGLCGTVFAGEGSTYNALSQDGEVVFFTVEPKGSTGCTASSPPTSEIYARLYGSIESPLTAETVHVSESKCTEECGPESGKNFEGANENGTQVFFTSTQKLTNGATDGTQGGSAAKGEGCAATEVGKGGCSLYEYNFDEPQEERLKLVSKGGEVLGVVGIAESGARVYFVSRMALSGSGQNEYNQVPQLGLPNLYVYDAVNNNTTFIATLGVGNGDERDWRRSAGRRMAEVAGDRGRFLLFASATPGLTPDDHATQTQLFEYDADTAELVRVTKGEDEYNEDGNNVSYGVQPASITSFLTPLQGGFDFKSATHRLIVSENGKSIFFETRGQLSPRAVSAAAGCSSVYEFHSNGSIDNGSVHLLSDGRDVQLNKGNLCGAQLVGIDADGNNVLFTTADALSPSDLDGQQRDIYDARVDGGFESPVAAKLCISSECEEASNIRRPMLLGSAGQSAEAGVVSSPAAAPPAVSHHAKSRKALARARPLRACQTRPRRLRAKCRRYAKRSRGAA